jgi:restriction system protein
MPSQYLYRQTIRNEYLGVSKTIRAMTRNEFEWLARAQLAKWDEQESRRRQAQQKNAEREAARHDAESTKSQAAEDTAAAKERIEAFGSILVSGQGYEPQLDWNGLLDRRSFYPFAFDQATPDRDAIRLQILGPEPNGTSPGVARIYETAAVADALVEHRRR